MNRVYTTSAALTCALVLLVSESVGAQHSVRAKDVAGQVQAFYDQTHSFRGTFLQTFYMKAYGRYKRSVGKVTFSKPGKMRFDYAESNGRVVVANGDKVIAYDPPEEKGAKGQYLETNMTDGALPNAFGFLTGTARIEDTYHVKLLNARAWRFKGHILQLTPKKSHPQIKRVILYVDAAKKRSGVVHRVRIDDHEGNRNKFELRRMKFNRSVKDSVFAFTPPKGSRRL